MFCHKTKYSRIEKYCFSEYNFHVDRLKDPEKNMEQKEPKEQIFTIPNILALIRLFLVPVVVVLIFKDRLITALIVFIIACLTDIADGYIARKYDMITQLGKFLDPLADKAMAVMVIIAFTIRGILPLWVTIVIFAKELMMGIGGMIAARHINKIIPSNKFGKIAAAIFNISIGTCFLYKYLDPYYKWFVYVALFGSVVSMVQYAVKNREAIFNKEKQG